MTPRMAWACFAEPVEIHSGRAFRINGLTAAPADKDQVRRHGAPHERAPALCNWSQAHVAAEETLSSWKLASGSEGPEKRHHRVRWPEFIIVCIRTTVVRGVIVASNGPSNQAIRGQCIDRIPISRWINRSVKPCFPSVVPMHGHTRLPRGVVEATLDPTTRWRGAAIPMVHEGVRGRCLARTR